MASFDLFCLLYTVDIKLIFKNADLSTKYFNLGRVNLFFKIGQFPTSLSLIFNTVIVNKYNLQMTGFELWISGV